MKKNSANKKKNVAPTIFAAAVTVLILLIGFFGLCIPLNPKSQDLWLLVIIVSAAFCVLRRLALGHSDFGYIVFKKDVGPKGRKKQVKKLSFNAKPYIVPIALLALFILIQIFGSTFFNAQKYAAILDITDSEFSQDISESVGTDSIALMDTASAKMLGDREIGSLSNVSQFNVSDNYTQIDYNGKPVKVSALEYAGFFKWLNNKSEGVRGYITVDPVSMSASFNDSEGMKYVPSAHFFQNARRHIWLKYPTAMIGNIHFEIDEDGKPYYIASVYDNTISLFGGKTVKKFIFLDPVTGNVFMSPVENAPNWIDVIFDGDLICRQYNWFGMLKNGYLNSLVGKKGCKQVTEYTSDGSGDSKPISDYGYVAKNGDIWIYTGVTSVNGDSSNIGFLLANERTGRSFYYTIAGADEKSAMAAAEGEVQEKGYQASFPSLINVSGKPTYIMVLKDSGGLVKLYAAVNVEQYNIVSTAATQAECLAKYKDLLGIDDSTAVKPTDNVTITVSQIKYIDIDGNTYIYLIDTDNRIYKAKASSHEDMLLLKEGDKVSLSCSNSLILECKKLS